MMEQRRTVARAELDAAIDYVRANPEVWEVILTGGDPLSLSGRRLGDILERLGIDRARGGSSHSLTRAHHGSRLHG